jgi:hypothetical protein
MKQDKIGMGVDAPTLLPQNVSIKDLVLKYIAENSGKDYRKEKIEANFSPNADVLKAIATLEQAASGEVSHILTRWNVDGKGKITGGKRPDLPKIVALTGTYGAKLLLTKLIESKAHESVYLPFGDLGQIKASAVQRIQQYLSMIAMRAEDIPDVDFKDVLIIKGKEDDNADSLEAEIKNLNLMAANAKERYLIQQVIMPLMRDILVEKNHITGLTEVPVLDTAKTYSKWKQNTDKAIMRQPMLVMIVETLSKQEWLNSYVALRDTLITGVDQSAFIGLPLLISATTNRESDGTANATDATETGALELGSESADSRWAFSKSKDDVLTSVTPLYSLARRTVLQSLDKNPLWVEDSFEAILPDEIAPSDIAWLIRELVSLKSVETTDAMSLEFISRYHTWSGLITNSTSITPTDRFKKFVDDYLLTEYVRYATKLPAVDTSIMTLFDEPNRADLQKSSADKMYFMALTHKVALAGLTEILTCLKDSYEFGHSEFWEGLNDTLELPGKTDSMFLPGFVHTRTYGIQNPLMSVEKDKASLAYYFMEKSVRFVHPVTDHLTDLLNKTNSLSTMTTNLMSIRHFSTSDEGYFDESELVGCAEVAHLADVGLEAIAIDTIRPNDYLGRHLKQLTPRKYRNKAAQATHVIVGKAKPTIFTAYNLTAMDTYPFEIVEFKDSDFDLSSSFNVIENYYSDTVRVISPVRMFEIVSADQFSYSPTILKFMPNNNSQFKELITRWEHSMNFFDAIGDGDLNPGE